MAQRAAPYSRIAERSLIGACLLNSTMIDVVSDMVAVDDFLAPLHQRIWETIVAAHQAGDAVEVGTIAARYRGAGQDEILVTLTDITIETPSTYSATTHASTVRDLSIRRQAIAVGQELVEKGYGTDMSTDDILGWTLKTVQDLDDQRGVKGPVTAVDALENWLARERAIMAGEPQPVGVPTGLVDLDERLVGLRPGQLITVAARPSMGKTAAVLQWAVNATNAGHDVLFVSVEMSTDELSQRLIASGAKIDMQRIRAHNYVTSDWAKIDQSLAARRDAGTLWILDDGSATVPGIRSSARRIPNLGLIVVDYLQILTPARNSRENRQIEVGEMVRGLKAIARDLEVPLIAAAQLNRSLESRSDKRPMLSDLRESGEIEATSDVVISIYRDEVYDPESEDRGVAEFIVNKQRNGPLGTTKTAYFAHHLTFENMARL